MVILEGIKVTRYFGGVAAVDRVDFEIRRGEIFGLIGPNGAGKTTLLNLISGVLPLTGGEIRFKGRKLNWLKPHQITRLGIARTFQVVKPFHGMSLKENVAVGALFGSREQPDVRRALKKAEETLELVGLAHKREAYGHEITISDRKRLELARALAMEPDLLLLDEVMAGLNPTEVEKIMELIRQVNARGITILIIEHVMKAIMGVSHRVLVLHHGQKIALGTPEEIVKDDKVIQAYLGERYAKARRQNH